MGNIVGEAKRLGELPQAYKERRGEAQQEPWHRDRARRDEEPLPRHDKVKLLVEVAPHRLGMVKQNVVQSSGLLGMEKQNAVQSSGLLGMVKQNAVQSSGLLGTGKRDEEPPEQDVDMGKRDVGQYQLDKVRLSVRCYHHHIRQGGTGQ